MPTKFISRLLYCLSEVRTQAPGASRRRDDTCTDSHIKYGEGRNFLERNGTTLLLLDVV